MRTTLVALLFLFLATVAHGAATPIVCPNNSQTGNSANCLQPPVLAFGNQGTSTASMAIPISVNNCATTNIAACSGSGSLTLSNTPFAISGTNAGDFSFSLGGCTANLVIATGGTCSGTITFTPTATAGTAETATLTVSYSGVTSSTMSLTGTSATVTALPACGSTLTNGVLYQASGNITCNGTGFLGQVVSINLNGFTLTFNNTNQTTQTCAICMNNFGGSVIAYNGTISQGAGTNSYLPGTAPSVTNILSVIGPVNTSASASYSFGDGSQFFNLTFNYSFQYWNAIATPGPGTNGGNSVIHDVTVNDTAKGTCSAPGCRNTLQSTPIINPGTANANGTHWYNIVINGSAQGGLGAAAAGAVVEHNIVYIGSNSGSAGTNSNNFGIYCWGSCTAHDNIVALPLQAYSSGRGVQMAADGASGNKIAYNNVIQAFALADSTEYSGCAIGGTYGVQFDDNPTGANNFVGNTVNVFAKNCGSTGLRVTDSRVTTNTSTNNIYTSTRQAGASTCSMGTEQDPQPGCAFGMSVNGNFSPQTEAFTSIGDTFTADTGIICLCEGAANNSAVKLFSPTFNKGSNPSATWHTFWFTFGGPGQIYVIDATTGPGVSLTDASIPAQGSFVGAGSFYIQWTQTVFVQGATNGKLISGATVTYTDAQSNAPSCTTDSTGSCSVIVTQYRLNNDTGANQVENHNTQTLAVSASGCTTNTQTGLVIASTNTSTVTLAGCGGTITTGTLPTLFGFDQTLFGSGHENTGLTYGWQRSWDTPCVWALIEATAGTYNFTTQCNAFVQSAVNHNAGVTLTIGRTPAVRITGTCSGSYGTGCAQLASDIDSTNAITTAFINAWSSYMTANWPGVKWRVEGRNEADLSGECAENSSIGGHCSMVHLVKEQQTIYSAVKAINPAIQVLCPAASTFNHFGVHLYNGVDSVSAPFAGSGFAAAGGLNFCDVMAVHPYFFASGATCGTSGSNSACVPEEAVNGSSGGCSGGGLGQIACLLTANGKSGMPVESSETDWGSTPPNLLSGSGGLTDTGKRQWIGRYIVYAWNSGQTNITWYTWECPSGVLSGCFGTLSGSSVTSAGLTALGQIQDWLIGSTNSASPCTIVSGTTYECALVVNTSSGKSGNAHIVFDNSGATPTISAFGANTAYRLDGTTRPVIGNLYTVDGEPTLLMSISGGPQPVTAPAVLFAKVK